MINLTWPQVHAWRLEQHYLTRRLSGPDFLQAVSSAGGLQAQVMSAAVLGVWARTEGLAPQTVPNALWQERSLVKTWAMRGTLHLISAVDYPLLAAARNWKLSRPWIHFFEYFGISLSQCDAYFEALPQVLGAEPVTREELAASVASSTGIPALFDLVRLGNWGSPLKPFAFLGQLCFGPSRGQNVTFVNPRKWLGTWQSLDPDEAYKEVARRYLRSFGPAAVTTFAHWWAGGQGLTAARKVFKSLSDELEEVSVEGTALTALRSTIDSMQAVEPSGIVRLLPLFDAYPIGIGRDQEAVLPAAHKFKVFRPQGWISAVVLQDGVIRGTWEYKTRSTNTALKVSLFEPGSANIHAGLEAEAARLGNYLNSRMDLVLDYAFL